MAVSFLSYRVRCSVRRLLSLFSAFICFGSTDLLGGVVERHVAKSIVWMCSFQRWSGGVERADNQRDEKFGTTCR